MATKQQVKVYDQGNINKAFQEDAESMARQGYRIASQSYGGTKPQSWFSTLNGPREPKEMTVIYEKDE